MICLPVPTVVLSSILQLKLARFSMISRRFRGNCWNASIRLEIFVEIHFLDSSLDILLESRHPFRYPFLDSSFDIFLDILPRYLEIRGTH